MQNKDYDTKAIIEAGLISALIVVIMLLSVYVPIFDLVGVFILPIPVTILYVKHDFKVTLTSVVVSGIIVAFMYNPILALTTAFLYGSMGIILGYCIKKNKGFGFTISMLALASLVGIIFKFVVYALFIDKRGVYGLINNILQQFIDGLKMARNTYESWGIDKKQLALVDEMINTLKVDVLISFIPGMLIVFSYMSAYLNYIITKAVMKKLKYEINDVTPFSKLYVPNLLGAFLIIVLCIGIILSTKDIPIGTYIQNTTQVIILFSFMISGMSVAAYYLIGRFNWPKGWVAVLLIITYFLSPINMIYFYIGLADLIFDFRKVDPNRVFKN